MVCERVPEMNVGRASGALHMRSMMMMISMHVCSRGMLSDDDDDDDNDDDDDGGGYACVQSRDASVIKMSKHACIYRFLREGTHTCVHLRGCVGRSVCVCVCVFV